MPLKLVRNDITKMSCDIVVNTANSEPLVGPGCDYAIYRAAGRRQLMELRKNIGHVEEGDVFLTPGLALPAKYIIHAVSPLYTEGDEKAEEKLRSCYRKSLDLALACKAESIAFPLISSGSYGWPKEEAMQIAVEEIDHFLENHRMLVYLVVFGKEAVRLGRRVDRKLESYIDSHYVDRKLEEEYGSLPGSWAAPSAGRQSEQRPEEPDHIQRQGQFEGKNQFEGKDQLERQNRLERLKPAPERPKPAPERPKPVRERLKPAQAQKSPETQYGQQMPDFPEIQFEKMQAVQAPLPRKLSKTPAARKKMAPPADHEEALSADHEEALRADEKEVLSDRFEEDNLMLDLADREELLQEKITSGLAERIKHRSDTFSEYLLYLIESRGMTNADVYKRAIVSKKVFSKIKNNPDAHPQKMTCMCLCVGAKLNLDETRDLLARAGYALSPCDMTDIIFSFFIENQIYDMIELDLQLEEHGLPCLIS